MRSVQPVLGPGVSEPLERTSSVCSCRQKFRDSVSPPRGERREASCGVRLDFCLLPRETGGTFSYLCHVGHTRLNGRLAELANLIMSCIVA
jgi:hypothetical protein